MSEKDRLLGMPHSTASNRLRKTILYSMLYGKVYDRNCFQCGEPIVSVDDMSIEHKEPWQSSVAPQAAFFNLENIAFSHLTCNSAEGNRNRLPQEDCAVGHDLSEDDRQADGYRHCRTCRQRRQKVYNANRTRSRSSTG